MSNIAIRRTLPMVLLSACATIVVLDYFITQTQISSIAEFLTEGSIVLAGFMAVTSGILVFRRRIGIITNRDSGWLYHAWSLAIFALTIVIGVVYGSKDDMYKPIYNLLIYPIHARRHALGFFWITAATYRAFKIRTLESVLLFVTFAIIMLDNTPMWPAIIPGLSDLATWILGVITSAGQRAMIATAALGAIAMSLRILLGREKGHFGL
jgi:predicted anti-sigma-YlaC factor YlaD